MRPALPGFGRRRAIAGTAPLCLTGIVPWRALAATEASGPPVHPLAGRLAAYAVPGGATVIGTGRKTTADLAALLGKLALQPTS